MPREAPDRIVTERAVLKTVLYSDLFDYALTPDEVAHYLMDIPTRPDIVRASLTSPVWLNGQILQVDGYVTIKGRESLVERRRRCLRSSSRLWSRARWFSQILSCLPFVRMVGITGALAMFNSEEGDDVDVMIVTTPNRVWLARAFCILVVYAGKVTGHTLCPNYVVSENALELEPRSQFVAHEFIQMVPTYGVAVCRRMRAANPWIEGMVPNAKRPLFEEPELRPNRIRSALKRFLEWMLSGRVGDRLEEWEMRRKLRKFQPMRGPNSSVILDRDHVKGHFFDHGAWFARLYEARLVEFNLVNQPSRQGHDLDIHRRDGASAKKT